MPRVRAIGFSDILSCLWLGWSDFRQAPLYGLFFGSFYAAWGIAMSAMLTVLHMAYLVFPVSIGFVLIGPFVAVGLYEVSRRLERGEALTWSGVIGVIWLQRQRELVWMAFVMLFVFWIWMYQVRLLLALFLGFQSFSDMAGFVRVVLTTSDGVWFLIVGNIVGAVLVAGAVLADGDLVPAAARPRGRLHHRHDHLGEDGDGKRGADDRVGPDRGGGDDSGLAAGLPRASGGAAGARPHHLAPLSPGGGSSYLTSTSMKAYSPALALMTSCSTPAGR